MTRKMRILHRSIGSIIAVFVLILAMTGIMLNHTQDLKLDSRYLTWGWLLRYYHVGEVKPDRVYLLDRHAISQFGTQVFIDATPVFNVTSPLVGGIVNEDLMILATKDELFLFTHDGELIEKMGAAAGIPPDIQNIGLFHGDPVVQTRHGMWRSDFMLDEWQPISLPAISWSTPQPLPDNVAQALAHYFRGKGVTIERVVLDIHNGHILGQFGRWVMDLVAILLMFIALTGFWMWVKQR